MTTPYRPRSPRWSVLLRIGAGVTVFGVFVWLFSYPATGFGQVLLALGVACLLASLVSWYQDRTRRRRP